MSYMITVLGTAKIVSFQLAGGKVKILEFDDSKKWELNLRQSEEQIKFEQFSQHSFRIFCLPVV